MLLKVGRHLLHITGKAEYRLSRFVYRSIEVMMSKTCSEGWAVRHNQSTWIYHHPVVAMSPSQWNSPGLYNIAEGFDRFSLKNFVRDSECWKYDGNTPSAAPVHIQHFSSNPLTGCRAFCQSFCCHCHLTRLFSWNSVLCSWRSLTKLRIALTCPDPWQCCQTFLLTILLLFC